VIHAWALWDIHSIWKALYKYASFPFLFPFTEYPVDGSPAPSFTVPLPGCTRFVQTVAFQLETPSTVPRIGPCGERTLRSSRPCVDDDGGRCQRTAQLLARLQQQRDIDCVLLTDYSFDPTVQYCQYARRPAVVNCLHSLNLPYRIVSYRTVEMQMHTPSNA